MTDALPKVDAQQDEALQDDLQVEDDASSDDATREDSSEIAASNEPVNGDPADASAHDDEETDAGAAALGTDGEDGQGGVQDNSAAATAATAGASIDAPDASLDTSNAPLTLLEAPEDIDAPIVDNELIVVYEDDSVNLDDDLSFTGEETQGVSVCTGEGKSVPLEGQSASLADLGVKEQDVVVDESDNEQDIALVRLEEGADLETSLELIRASDQVADVQPNFTYECLYAPNDPYCKSGTQSYLSTTKTTTAWNRVKTNGAVTVAVVDSGINALHPDLSGNIVSSLAWDAHKGAKMSGNSDLNGHGTKVSGIIAGKADNGLGVAGASFNAKLLPVKVFYEVDGRVIATTADLIKAYDYLDERIETKKASNLKVVNLSLGYASTGSYNDMDRQVRNAIRKLREDHGVLTVCAGGNISQSMRERDVVYPADFDECFSVTSLDADKAESSFTCVNRFKDLSAPGEGVFTTTAEGSYSSLGVDGSSFASPQVAAAAALLWTAQPGLSPSQVETALKKSAGKATLKSGSGSAGILDVDAALTLVKGSDWESATTPPASGKRSMSAVSVTMAERYFYYDGNRISPEVTVKDGSSHLRLGVDYTLSYANNRNAGTATAKVQGIGKYSGSKSVSFTIMPASIESAKLSGTRFTYRGHAVTPGVTVRADVAGVTKTIATGITRSNSNVTLSYSAGRTNVGTYSVRVTGKGNYTGSTTVTFQVVKAPLNSATAVPRTITYDGKTHHPALKVTAKHGGKVATIASKATRSTKDFVVSYPAGCKKRGSYTVAVTGRGNYTGTVKAIFKIAAPSPSVEYSTHVQNIGWQTPVINAEVAGTTGKGLRAEAVRIKLVNKTVSGGIRYRPHVQSYGWMGWSSNGAVAGTTGKKKRLEAIQIELTGAMKSRYDVYYSAHCQKLGWTGWAKNGQKAGSEGYGYRLEALKIKLVPKGGPAPGKTSSVFHKK